MEPLHPERLRAHLEQLVGNTVYIHLEVNPGAYWRNGQAILHAAHVRGEHDYRVFLELDAGLGLIQVDQLTHMQLAEDQVICTGYDEHERLARTVEISRKPFAC